MSFKLNGNKVQNTEETASEITSVNGNADTKSNEDRQPKSESFRSFTEETSLHGARFLFSSNIFRRLFWTLLLMLNIGYCVYHIYESVDFYYQRPFNTKITTKTANNTTNMPFPAVTLCNLNLFNLRRFRSFQIRSNMSIKEIEEKGKVYAKMLAGSKDAFNNDSKRNHEELFWRFDGEDSSFFYLNAFSHKIEDMLLPASIFDSCFIDETGCGPQNFTRFTSSTFGQCYTFNSGRDGHPVINATMAGQLNGLKLLLNIERDNYLDNPLNPFAGLAVLVHDQQTFPFMEQFGFVVQPGVRTLCSIKRKKIINLESPFAANCIKDRNMGMLENTHYAYSKTGCLMQCLAKFVIARCGCRLAEYKDLKVPLCAPNDTLLCSFPSYRKYGKSKFKDECEVSCQEPCSHTEYETSLSYAGLQRNVFIEKLSSYIHLTEEFPFYEHFMNLSHREKKEYIDENIISLDIFFHDMSYDEIKQTMAYEPWTLLANLGGTFGLFLGMSILTILELVEFIIRRICSMICK